MRILQGVITVTAVTAVSVWVTWAGDSTAQRVDWSQWRGPGRNGVTTASSGWTKGKQFHVRWKANVGRGFSSPILVGGRCYALGWSRKGSTRKPRGNPIGRDTLFCLDAASGKELWQASYPARYQGRYRTGDTGAYGGPSATPTCEVKAERMYTLGIDGMLVCWDTRRKGRRIWSVNLYDKFGGDRRPSSGGGRRDFGMTSSPLLIGEWVVVEAPTDRGTLLALDRKTGNLAWESAWKGPAGHTSGPVAAMWGGRRVVLTLALKELVVIDASDDSPGRTLARWTWATKFACNLPTPAVTTKGVLLTSGYNHKECVLLRWSENSFTQAWRSRSHATVSSPVVHKGRTYLVGGALECIDLASGRRLWRGGRFGHGSCLVTADDKCLVWGKGTLALVELGDGSDRYRELTSKSGILSDTCSPHVAFDGTSVVVKNRSGSMVCLELQSR